MAENKRTRWQRRPGTTGGKYRGMTGVMPRPGVKRRNYYCGNEYLYCHHVLVLGALLRNGSSTTFVARPGGIEGWLPIAG